MPYQKCTRSIRNTDASIIRTHSGGPMVSAIEGFHCNICLCTHWVHEFAWNAWLEYMGHCVAVECKVHILLFHFCLLHSYNYYTWIVTTETYRTVCWWLFWVRTVSGTLHAASDFVFRFDKHTRDEKHNYWYLTENYTVNMCIWTYHCNDTLTHLWFSLQTGWCRLGFCSKTGSIFVVCWFQDYNMTEKQKCSLQYIVYVIDSSLEFMVNTTRLLFARVWNISSIHLPCPYAEDYMY